MKSRQYHKKLAAGMCGVCGKRPPLIGKRQCRECRDRLAEQRRARYRTVRAAGLCATCRKAPALSGKAECEACVAKERKAAADRAASKLCVTCTKRGREPGKRRCAWCLTHARSHYRRLKDKIFAHYGAVCGCCGETDEVVLTLDHVNNDGAEHRRQLTKQRRKPTPTCSVGGDFLRWVIRNNYPPSIQVLCFHCNIRKHKTQETTHWSTAWSPKACTSDGRQTRSTSSSTSYSTYWPPEQNG